MSKLRIGIIGHAKGRSEPWIIRLIHQISKQFPNHLIYLIESHAPSPAKPSSLFANAISALENFFIARPTAAETSYEDLDGAVFHKLALEDVEALNSIGLDIIIDCIGLPRAQLSILSPKYGVWTLDFLLIPEACVGFWANYKSDAVLQIRVCRHTQSVDLFDVISSAAINTKISAARNALFMKEKSIALILKALAKLDKSRSVPIKSQINISQAQPPNLLEALHYSFKLCRSFFIRVMTVIFSKLRFRPEMYYLKLGAGGIENFDPGITKDIFPPDNSYWADPFLYEKNGRLYVFFETYDYKAKRGHISVGYFNGDDFVTLGEAIKTQYHMSFPFLFEEDGDLFMVPETNATKRIELWKCIEFPLKWQLHATALEGFSAADTVILKHDDAWWVFTNISTDVFNDHCSELHIFKSRDISFNELEPHEDNPVVFDSRFARNAGRIVYVDGKLFRPSQVNAYGEYGYGLNIMEILELSLTQYKEKCIKMISPDTHKERGCHHFDSLKGQFIIDTRKKMGGWR